MTPLVESALLEAEERLQLNPTDHLPHTVRLLCDALAALNAQPAREDRYERAMTGLIQARDRWAEAEADRDKWKARYEEVMAAALNAQRPTPGEQCICAAIKLPNGEVWRGHRHDDAIRVASLAPDTTVGQIRDSVQGFITSRNRFVGREEGAAIQRAVGIVSAQTGRLPEEILFSEDLYLRAWREAVLGPAPDRPHFTCPTCGPHVGVDDDGCCRMCGADCTAVPGPAEAPCVCGHKAHAPYSCPNIVNGDQCPCKAEGPAEAPALAEFKKAMAEEVIPKIVRTVEERQRRAVSYIQGDTEAELRTQLETERTMHAAWRKRAEEAEAREAKAKAEAPAHRYACGCYYDATGWHATAGCGTHGHMMEAPALDTPKLYRGHIDPDCEVVRQVGGYCTCQTPAEKAERQAEEAEIEREQDATAQPSPVPRAEPDVTVTDYGASGWDAVDRILRAFPVPSHMSLCQLAEKIGAWRQPSPAPTGPESDGDDIHTGDDDLLDALTGVRTALESLDDPDEDRDDAIRCALEELMKADQLRVAELKARASAPTWQPIESAPKMQNILLFVPMADGNWEMGSGFWHTGYNTERSHEDGFTPWCFNGQQLKLYHPQPTLWTPLPAPPAGRAIT